MPAVKPRPRSVSLSASTSEVSPTGSPRKKGRDGRNSGCQLLYFDDVEREDKGVRVQRMVSLARPLHPPRITLFDSCMFNLSRSVHTLYMHTHSGEIFGLFWNRSRNVDLTLLCLPRHHLHLHGMRIRRSEARASARGTSTLVNQRLTLRKRLAISSTSITTGHNMMVPLMVIADRSTRPTDTTNTTSSHTSQYRTLDRIMGSSHSSLGPPHTLSRISNSQRTRCLRIRGGLTG